MSCSKYGRNFNAIIFSCFSFHSYRFIETVGSLNNKPRRVPLSSRDLHFCSSTFFLSDSFLSLIRAPCIYIHLTKPNQLIWITHDSLICICHNNELLSYTDRISHRLRILHKISPSNTSRAYPLPSTSATTTPAAGSILTTSIYLRTQPYQS